MMQMEEACFISYSRSFIVSMQDEGRYDAANKLNMYLRKFATFLGKNEIPFKDFDSLLIRNYNTWLENQKLGRNSISLYIRNLKRVYQLAVADGATCENHPFEDVDVSYRVKKDKSRLTPKDVIQLRYMGVSNLHPSVIFARDLFFFAVFTNGMTGGDLFYLTKDNIKGDRLTYTSKATGKEETVTWNSYLQEIVDKYSHPDTLYLFPIITSKAPKEQWRQHDTAIHNINCNLKKVGQIIGLSFSFDLDSRPPHLEKHNKRVEDSGLAVIRPMRNMKRLEEMSREELIEKIISNTQHF